ncbi:DUF3108 domain-containing protein [Gallaecimonas mangrovi]|uniref:DUF3108 domain-containing protein n=1 Tax=Gallaecimonas mangrovi TaxID=2291597 RepID=UPI000E208D31|nr:DUF3108 domain-containing protein [Gallaecimonas mangrovi]
MWLRNTLISLTLAATASLPAFASSALTPYEATYKIMRKGKALGVGTRSLTKAGDLYTLHNASDLSWLIFTDQREESSTFQVENQHINPASYDFKRTGTGPDEKEKMTFDGNTVKSDKNSLTLKGPAYDPLTYQQQLAMDLAAGKKDVSYDIVKDLKIKHYHFKVVGEERITTPYGAVDTLRVERVRGKNSSRHTLFWLAPKLHYALVRLWQAKDNVEQMELVLSEYHDKGQTTSAQ